MEQDNRNDIREQDVNEVRKGRIEKLSELVAAGRNPFEIVRFDRTATSAAIKGNYADYEGKSVSVAGRMMSKRIMGKAAFGHINDADGDIQVYFSRDDLGQEEYAAFKKLDVGDIIGVKGTVFTTKTGEITVHAKEVTLLTKSLLPLPEKFHGLKDPELRYRQRYVDLIANPEVKELFVKRSKIVSALREFLEGEGFYEVETPVLNMLAGGANARPFITHHNTLDVDMYLRIALELYLKRCIVGGFDKVFEIGRVFRNEGMDPRHNPEFTLIELYQAYADYADMMDIAERMVKHCAMKVCGTLEVEYQGEKINFGGTWQRLSMVDAVRKYTGMDFDAQPLDELIAEANKRGADRGLKLAGNASWGTALAEVFDKFVEENLAGPVFIVDYPVEISPLAKKKKSDPRLTERFELFVTGKELANAFSELNDPIDQRERFAAQMLARQNGDEEAQPYDEDFVTALEYGMPPTGGLGMGVDRLVMFLTDSYSIREVLLFPTMKPR